MISVQRLQVVLARGGAGSRRGVVSLIEAGRVAVNGAEVREKGFKVDPERDRVAVDGKILSQLVSHRKRYFIFNKPQGVTTTVRDPHAKKTTADFFKDVPARLFPVGRLDRDTTGLLIMTNDGDLAFRLSHPRFEVEKRYKVEVKGRLTDEETRRLEKGAVLKEGKTAPCKIQIRERTDTRTRLLIALHEGKKRHIRRIFDKAGHPVRVLERLDIGPLSLGNLKPGERRELKPAEVLALKKAVDPRVV